MKDKLTEMSLKMWQLVLRFMRFFSALSEVPKAQELSETESGLWCVVANIKRDHPYGPGGTESKSGTRQFRGGAKVYIAGCNPGMCDSVLAIGLHRRSRRFIACYVDVQHVEQFRVKMACHPKVIELIKNDPRCWIRTREEAEVWVTAFPKWQRLYR